MDCTVGEIVGSLSQSFRSLDIRTVAVRADNQWENVVTSLFFSNEPPTDVLAAQKNLLGRLSHVASSRNFALAFFGWPFSRLSGFFQQIIKGSVSMGLESVKFRSFDPYSLKVDRYLPRYLKGLDQWKLLGAEGKASDMESANKLWPLVWDENRNANLDGYDRIEELICDALGLASQDFRRERDFVIGMPTYARIAEVTPSVVKIRKHYALDDLQLNLSLERIGKYESQTIERLQEPVDKSPSPSEGDLCIKEIPFRFEDIKPDDRIVAKLICKEAPVELDISHIFVPLEKPLEPFAKTIFEFCGIDDYKKRLFSPELYRKGKKRDVATEFEEAVSWLLSLAGYSVIRLGRYEILRTGEYEIGSADLLAYRDESLLVVECDTSMPDPKKMNYLLQVRGHLRSLLAEYKRLSVMAAVFSSQDCGSLDVPAEIGVIDKHGIKRLFEEVMRGKTAGIEDYLASSRPAL